MHKINYNKSNWKELGINASTSFYGEESDQIPTWKINGNNTDGLFDFSSTDWQFVTLQLNDLIRSKLSSYHDARLIIIKNPDSITEASIGTVYFGPYEPYTQLLFTHADSNIVLTTRTTPKESPSSKELYISPNYSTVLNWNYISEPLISDLSKIHAVKYFEAADFSSYNRSNEQGRQNIQGMPLLRTYDHS